MGTGFDMIQSLWVLSNYMKLKLKPLILTFLYQYLYNKSSFGEIQGVWGSQGQGGWGVGTGFDMIQSLWVLSNYMKLKLKPLILTFLYQYLYNKSSFGEIQGVWGSQGQGGWGWVRVLI